MNFWKQKQNVNPFLSKLICSSLFPCNSALKFGLLLLFSKKPKYVYICSYTAFNQVARWHFLEVYILSYCHCQLHTCMHTYICIYIYTYVYICIHMYVHICTCTQVISQLFQLKHIVLECPRSNRNLVLNWQFNSQRPFIELYFCTHVGRIFIIVK
jgi:hypothetical protein